MSDACHANTSTFARRKATSALSYLLSRVELIVKAPPVPSSLTGTFLVSVGATLDLLLPLAELSGTSLTGKRRSEEALLPEEVQEFLPGSEVLLEGAFPGGAEALPVFFPPRDSAAGTSALAVAAATADVYYTTFFL